MLKRTAILIIIGIVLLAAVDFFLLAEFNVEQSIEIKARPENIHAYVSDLKQWPKWSPWKEKDAKVVIHYGNVTKGVGASQWWQGKGGKGRIHITVSSPRNGIAYDLFFSNAKTPSISAIEYKEIDADLTRVTWRIHGEIERPVFGGYIAVMVRFMTRARYQKGLARLKTLVEGDN